MDSEEKLRLIEEKMIQQEKIRDKLNLRFNHSINQQRKQLNIHRNLKTYMKKKVVRDNMLSKLGDNLVQKFQLKKKRKVTPQKTEPDEDKQLEQKVQNPLIKNLMGRMSVTLKD